MSAESMFTHISNSLLKQDPRPKIEKGKWICEQSSRSLLSATVSAISLSASVRKYRRLVMGIT